MVVDVEIGEKSAGMFASLTVIAMEEPGFKGELEMHKIPDHLNSEIVFFGSQGKWQMETRQLGLCFLCRLILLGTDKLKRR